MKLRYGEEIMANLKRAGASIGAAKKLVSEGYFDFAASRAYYAAFYAAAALLLSEELAFGKHSGVIAAIHQRFVKTGEMEQRYGRDLNWLFELRGVGDYGVTVHVSRQDAENAIRAAKDFLSMTSMLIEERAGRMGD